MAKRKPRSLKSHAFRNKLLLNQWLISLFGINPLTENKLNGQQVQTFSFTGSLHQGSQAGRSDN